MVQKRNGGGNGGAAQELEFQHSGRLVLPLHFQDWSCFTMILDLAASVDEELWLKGGFPDVFSEEFRSSLDRVAKEKCFALKGNPWLSGTLPTTNYVGDPIGARRRVCWRLL